MNATTPAPAQDRLLTQREIAKMIGVSERTLLTWRNSGQFPAPDLAIENTRRWRRSKVEAWLDRQAAA